MKGIQQSTFAVHPEIKAGAQHTFCSNYTLAVSDAQYKLRQIQQGQVAGILTLGNVCTMNIFF